MKKKGKKDDKGGAPFFIALKTGDVRRSLRSREDLTDWEFSSGCLQTRISIFNPQT